MNGIRSETREVIVPSSGRRVSWGAIWAGMFVTVIMELMFILLGVVVGIKTLNPSSNIASGGGGGMAFGAMIWLMCSWLVAVWVGARVAGWMSGGPRRTDGVMHGMVVWSFSAAVILLFLTGAIGIFGGSGGGAAGGTSGGISLNSGAGAGQQQQALAPKAGGNTGGQAMGGVGGNAGTSGGGGGGNVTNQPNWGKALWTFVALILGLGVASAGGAMGASALYEEDRASLPAA